MPKLNCELPKEQSRSDSVRWLYGFLRPHVRRIAALFVLSLTVSAVVLVQPYFTKLIIDDGLLAGDFDALLAFSLSLLVLGLIATLLAGFNRIQYTRLSGSILFALREDVYQHLQRLSPRYFSQQRTGDLINRMDRDVSEVQRFAVDTLFGSVTGVLGLIGTVSMMLYLSWQLSLILVLLIPIEVFFLRWIRPRVQEGNRNVRERTADISSFLAETIPAIKFIQTSGAERREAGRLAGLNQLFMTELIQLQKTEFVASAVPSMLISSTRAAVFLMGGYWVIQGTLELGSLIAFSAYLGMAFGPVQSLLGLYLGWHRMVVSLDRVRELREQVPEVYSTEAADLPSGLRGELDLDSITFAHPGAEPIFQVASLHIPAGTRLGVYGASGSGKSTLIDLIQRHCRLDAGRILVDKQDVASFDIRQWRKAISVVSQDTVIFRDTIANNIRYCRPDSTDLEIKRAAALAGLEPLLSALPGGIQSVVGERGTSLSGGERQRIALARALLHKPVLLILDEPTSAIDEKSEIELIERIDQLFPDTTRIIISHRPTPIAHADLLVTIESGKLIAHGIDGAKSHA